MSDHKTVHELIGQVTDIDLGIQRHLFQVYIQDLHPLVPGGHGELNYVVEASRPEQGRLHQVYTVRRGHDQDTQ